MKKKLINEWQFKYVLINLLKSSLATFFVYSTDIFLY